MSKLSKMPTGELRRLQEATVSNLNELPKEEVLRLLSNLTEYYLLVNKIDGQEQLNKELAKRVKKIDALSTQQSDDLEQYEVYNKKGRLLKALSEI